MMKKLHVNKNTILFFFPSRLIPISQGGASRTLEVINYLRNSGFRIELITINHGIEEKEILTKKVDNLWLFQPPGPPKQKTIQAIPIHNKIRFKLSRIMKFVILKSIDKINHAMGLPVYDEEIPTLINNTDCDRIFIRISSSKLNPLLGEYVGEIAYKIRPVAAISNYAWFAWILDTMPPGTLKILDTFDVQHIRTDRAKAFGGDLSDRFMTREEEIHEIHRADVLMAIQSDEQSLLKKMCPDRQVILVEHGLDKKKLLSSETSMDLMIVGSLYEPNVMGIGQFLVHAWPRLKKEYPKVRLFICGRVSEELPKNEEGVFYEGVVPSLFPYYQMASIVVNPVPYSTGFSIKSLEALAYGKCLVTTPAGANIFSGISNPPCIIAPVEDMAEKIITLLRNPTKRRQIEDVAWKFAQDRFKPENAFRELSTVLRKRRDKALLLVDRH